MNEELEKLRELTKTITRNGYLSNQTQAWQYAFDSVNELVCITNLNFQIKFINKPLTKKLGIKVKPFINENLAKLFSYNIFSNDTDIGPLEDNSMYYGETYIEELGGWYERYRYYIESSSGKLIGYTFMLIDVTARKEVQIALEENEQLLRGVLDAIPDIIGVQDNNHNILTYNKAGRDHFKLTSQSMRNAKCYESLGRTIPCTDECQTKICKETKAPANLERFIEELDGWYDCRSYPILDDKGNVVKVIEHLRDISERKEEQKLIKEAFQRLRFLIAAMNSYIWEKQKLDDSGELTHTFADPSFCKKFYGLTDIESEEDFEVCKRAHNKKGSELLEDFRKKGDRIHSFGDLCISTDQHCEQQGVPCEYFEMGYIEHEKGAPEWIILKVRKTPIYNDKGECTGVVGFAHDCSALAETIQRHIAQGLEKGTVQKLDDGKTDARVYWAKERKSEGKKLNHLDFL